jgi:hypothetical protein
MQTRQKRNFLLKPPHPSWEGIAQTFDDLKQR